MEETFGDIAINPNVLELNGGQILIRIFDGGGQNRKDVTGPVIFGIVAHSIPVDHDLQRMD